MASIKMNGLDGYIDMLTRLGDEYDNIIPAMVNTGVTVVRDAMRRANGRFANYLTIQKAKKNSYGWFGKVQFKGTTTSGARAGLAAAMAEYGRAAGTYTDSKGNRRPYTAQPATPWIRAAISSAESETIGAMKAKHDEEVRRIMG